MATAFLTIPEVARLLRVGQRTVYSLARAGELAGAVKVGSQWRVEGMALRNWARNGGTSISRRSSAKRPRPRSS